MTMRFGVIPTNGRDCATASISALQAQVDHLAVVIAGDNVTLRKYEDGVTCLVDDTGGINISRWWNRGIDWAMSVACDSGAETWDIAIINDDVIIPPNWLCYIADDMRSYGCVAACSGGRISGPVVHRKPGPVDLYHRLQGFAFVIAGETSLRANESMRWYYSDDWLDWTAREKGGMVVFPGCHVQHKFPNCQVTPEMQVMISEDANKFKEYWGMMPW